MPRVLITVRLRISILFFQFFLLLVQISLLVSGQKRMEHLAHVMEITWNLCRYKLNDRVI